MNTIPLTFNQRQINRTVLGGKEAVPHTQLPVSVILLNQGGSHYRIQNLENLIKCGFESIISFETDPENYNIEDFAQRFPCVHFVVPLEPVTDGDLINIGMDEVKSDYVLVVRDTISITGDILTARLVSRITEQTPYCISPHLMVSNSPSFPNIFVPGVKRSELDVIPSSHVADGTPTLYPLDYIGLYNRQKFIQLGGYDYTILSPYWQNLDLSFRAWLWGEKISLSTMFNLSYLGLPPAEDTSANLFSGRFYLKNLLPHFVDDHALIPRLSFFAYYRRSGCGFFESLNQFGDARSWVEKNKYRFRFDAPHLIENWGNL
ncbi:MAG: hypothetical protein K6G80_06765 [Treponema sp.]|nr:hypothetical protein [Treponema sp.]